jgi:hypothetical protein
VLHTMEALRGEAKRRFLGRGAVVGVGVTDGREKALVFLLRKDSASTRNRVLNWARRRGARVRFIVTGEIQPLAAI